jgi:hypothetical protein
MVRTKPNFKGGAILLIWGGHFTKRGGGGPLYQFPGKCRDKHAIAVLYKYAAHVLVDLCYIEFLVLYAGYISCTTQPNLPQSKYIIHV